MIDFVDFACPFARSGPCLLRLSVGYTGYVNVMWKRFLCCYREVVGQPVA